MEILKITRFMFNSRWFFERQSRIRNIVNTTIRNRNNANNRIRGGTECRLEIEMTGFWLEDEE
jgi:hypothetical protein